MWHIFSDRFKPCHLSTKTTHSTTISPANYHQNTTRFSKTPSKTPIKPQKNSHWQSSNFFCQIQPTRNPAKPRVRSRQYEPLFRRRKPNNGDVHRRSAVEPVPSPRQAGPPAKSPCCPP